MNEFPIIPANKLSISRRSLIFGVGLNDSEYKVKPTIKGIELECPFYTKWKHMIERCYSKKFHKKHPTYKGCSVCQEWLIFSNFKKWMIEQDWRGLDLDKDIIKPDNKIYSPVNCCFITPSLNSLLTYRANKRGNWPQGVYWNKQNKKFRAQVNLKGRRIYLGLFNTPKSASEAYKEEKIKLILSEAEKQGDIRIANGLKLHAEILR